MIMVDRFDNWVEVFPIKRKSDAYLGLQSWIDAHGAPTVVRSDNGGEFDGAFLKLIREKGIRTRKSSPYTPQQNGSAEVHNRLVVQGLKCLLDTASLHDSYWSYAAVAFVYALNRSPRAVNGGISAYEKRRGYAPSTKHMRTFGTRCLYENHVRNKMGRNSFRGSS